jgi:hypothetical protein
VTGMTWMVLAAGVVAGWVLCRLWDAFLEWLYDTADAGASTLRDLLALAGVCAVVYGIYQATT